MEEIDLIGICNVIKKRSRIIVLTIIISIITSVFISYFVLETEYRSYTTLMINDVKSDQYNGGLMSIVTDEKLITTLKEIMKSSLIIDEVIRNLELDQSFLDINKQANVSIVENTGIIRISVNNKEPNISRDIANEFALTFIEYVDNNFQTLQAKVINKAQVPVKPSKPNLNLNMAIGGLLGIITGIFLVYFLEYTNNTIKASKDIEEKIQLPLIGQIPKFNIKINQNITSNIDESYKILRTNILSLTKNNIHSVLITSSELSEGKSNIISNIAIAMALNNKKVLLIDSNLRKPCIHKLFDITKREGLTDKLRNDSKSYDKFVQLTGIKNLHIMTSGHICMNSSEILGSDEMKYLLEEVKNNYDIVLLDSPPLESIADASVLSTITDATILICAFEETKIDELKHSKETLDKLDTNILGVILNKIE